MPSKFAPKGGLPREQLETLATDGLTLAEMAIRTERSIATVRYWLARHGIERAPAPTRPPMECRKHGATDFVLEGRGYYRCKLCRQERVTEWRRRVKRMIVQEAGGCCQACGYAACVAALQFHHVDPATKSFALSHKGLARSLDQIRAEAAKCVLLCANCHAEVEAGYRELTAVAA